MCSLSYSRLENWIRVHHLLSHPSLLDEATKGATTGFNVLLFLHIESIPGSVYLCSFGVSALFSQTPSWLWQMDTMSLVLLEVSFCQKGVFPFPNFTVQLRHSHL
ncbi:hypothetical protein ATANTOWER_032298 [Ataeniobius toweri]|uniref:Uncharacterized protein n=1 Tax=Ataeniobius toweri TaxID=208326 RepID=A0ABU7AU07_9TELE|nr:hypothetical protein [Ataeniobius toweri]